MARVFSSAAQVKCLSDVGRRRFRSWTVAFMLCLAELDAAATLDPIAPLSRRCRPLVSGVGGRERARKLLDI